MAEGEEEKELVVAVDSEKDVTQANAVMIEKPATPSSELEVRRMSVAPTLKRRSSSALSAIADIDLAELSLLDVLTQAAADVLGSIPAQRCVVFIYDKAAHLLRPQVVVDCDKEVEAAQATGNEPTEPCEAMLTTRSEKTADNGSCSIDADVASEEATASPLVSFPPVVGMISSCFLQRRCLRMQEPHPHRAFHREYDVPKDMQVDSILCAPVILYHRATAVIQLLNRLDTAARNPFEEAERAATPQDARNEATSEVRLRRLKTVKASVKTGFSTKDEQKLMHFTTHIAQTIEISTKKLANGRSHAKLREDKAKQALDLLNALNGNIVARVSSTERLVPTNTAEHTGRALYLRRATITRLPLRSGVLTDMLSALVIIMRLQAMFRGRRQRRAEKFAEELEKFGRQRERMRTMVVMQRVSRAPVEAKAKVYEKPVIPQMPRVKERSRHSSRIPAEEPQKPPLPPSTPSPTTPRKTPQRYEPVAPLLSPPPRPPAEPTRILKRRMSAAKIQKAFRRHRQRRPTPAPRDLTPPKLVVDEKLAKEIASAVKLQAFIRGSLVRKRLHRALLSARGPHIVCLRVASISTDVVSNQSSHESPRSTHMLSQTCVYAMPPARAPHMYQRRSAIRHSYEESNEPGDKVQDVSVESRRLFAMRKADDTSRLPRSPARRSRPRWDRLVSSVVWEAAQQPAYETAPPGVEFVQQRQPNARSELRRPDKVRSPPMTTALEAEKAAAENKSSVRLPALGLRTPLDPAKGSLLCCLLPAQTRRLPADFARPAVRRLAGLDSKVHRAKRRQSPAKVKP